MNQMSSKTRGLLCVAALAATLLLSPTSALAQEDPQGGGAGGSLLLSSTTTAFGGAYVSIIISAIASPLITTGGVITTIVAVLKKQEPVALALYLDENKALAAEAVAFGGGGKALYGLLLPVQHHFLTRGVVIVQSAWESLGAPGRDWERLGESLGEP